MLPVKPIWKPTCSTGNTFDISKVSRASRKPHGSMFQRDYSQIKTLLRQYRVTTEQIADYAAIALSTVHAALDLNKFGRVRYMTVMQVRWAAQNLLAKAGYQGDDKAFTDLWSEYDGRLVEGL